MACFDSLHALNGPRSDNELTIVKVVELESASVIRSGLRAGEDKTCATGLLDFDNVVLKGDCDGMSPIYCAELSNDRLDMFIDGSLRDMKNLSNVPSSFPSRRQSQNLKHSWCQRMGQRLWLDNIDEFPIAFSSRDCELMCGPHLQDVSRLACGKRVSAQGAYGLTDDRRFKVTLVGAKVIPVLRAQPKRISTDPHRLVALG